MIRTARITQGLLIPLCMVTCLLLLYNNRTRLHVSIEGNPNVYQMGQIIMEERTQTEHTYNIPKIIFQCGDDESAVKYPRRPSDDLTEIVMATSDECGDVHANDAIVIVHTAAANFDRRNRFRKTYGNYNNTKPYRLKVVFLIGSVLDAESTIRLEMENREYGDTVIGTFLDTYHNLTLKAVMGFRWVAETCAHAKLLIKMDDDVFFDVRKFFSRYWQKIGNDRKNRSVHCLVWHNAHVGRSGKWKVTRALFENSSFPFSYCAGFFVVVTPDLIKPFYMYGKSIDFFWIDDVFLYGMVPAIIKGVHFNQLGNTKNFLTESYDSFRNCGLKYGRDRCQMFVSLTDGEGQFDEEYNALFSKSSLLS